MPRTVLNTLSRWFDQAVNSPDAARACRSVAALMVPLLLAAAGWLGPGTVLPLEVTFVALSAQSLAGVDIRGPYPLRLGFLLTMIAIMAGSTALGTVVEPWPAAAALAAGLIALNAGAWRHLTPEYGPSLAAPVGLVFLIAANAAPDPAQHTGHWTHVLSVLAGSGWALLVQVALWPVRAQHGLRQAVGDSWRAASEFFDEMSTAGFWHPPADDADGRRGDVGEETDDSRRPDHSAHDHHDHLEDGKPSAVATAAGKLRTTLEAAYATLEGVGKGRPLVALLDSAMHAAGRLGLRAAGLATALEVLSDRPDVAALDTRFRASMEALASTARAIGLAVISRQPAHLGACEVRLQRATTLLASLRTSVLADCGPGTSDPDCGEAVPAARAREAGLRGQAVGTAALQSAARPTVAATPAKPHVPSPAARQVATIIELIEDQLADSVLALVALTDRAGERAVFPLELFDVNTWRLRPLAAALNLSPKPDPALLRFTARLAVLMTLGMFAVKWFPELLPGHPFTHGYWLPFTILVVSQTDYGATRKKAAERFGGTLVGSVLGSGLLMLDLPRAVLYGAASIAGFWFAFFLRREYRVAVVFITLLVVLLTEMNHPTSVELTAERLGLTAVGGALALAAALVFWPAWEKTRFPAMLAAALRANGEYARVVVARLRAGGTYTPEDVKVRRVAEKANAAALASLARLYADPANRRGKVERAAALANGSTKVGRYLNLMMVRAAPGARPVTDPALPAFADRVAASLAKLADEVQADGSAAAIPDAPVTSAPLVTTAGAATGAVVSPAPADIAPQSDAGVFAEMLARTQAELDAMRQSVRVERT